MKKNLALVITLFISSLSQAAVTYEEFKELVRVTHKVFEELKPSDRHVLYINKQPSSYQDPNSTEERFWWNLDTLNASFFQLEYEDRHEFYITMFGGFAKQDFMDGDALAVTLCHELAHGIGGEPIKENGTVTEGQADYFATKSCLPVFYKYYQPDKVAIASNSYIAELCKREDTRDNINYCIRAMNALHADMKFFEVLGSSSAYDEASSARPTEFNLNPTHYPDAQCRVDLMVHGVLGVERPNCFDPNGIYRIL